MKTAPSDIFDITSLDKKPETFICSEPRPVRHRSMYNIYPLSKLTEFLAELSKKPVPAFKEKDDLYKIRYLVDSNYNIWFAEEGGACATIPAHYQMTGEDAKSARCIAAGNIEFSPDYKTIININNKSGDFKPSFDGLKWVLAILASNKEHVTLASDLLIEKSPGGAADPSYELDPEQLIKWVNETFSKEQITLFQEQPTEIKKYTYTPPARDTSTPRRMYSPRLLFADSSTDSEPSTSSLNGKRTRPLWSSRDDDAEGSAAESTAGADSSSENELGEFTDSARQLSKRLKPSH